MTSFPFRTRETDLHLNGTSTAEAKLSISATGEPLALAGADRIALTLGLRPEYRAMMPLRQARSLPTGYGLEFHIEIARWHFPGSGKSDWCELASTVLVRLVYLAISAFDGGKLPEVKRKLWFDTASSIFKIIDKDDEVAN